MATTKTKAASPKAPDLTHRDGDDHQNHRDPDRGANIVLSIKLGPMVSFQIEGPNCTEITGALKGFEHLNQVLDAMFSDLAKRVYPDTDHAGPVPTGKEKS